MITSEHDVTYKFSIDQQTEFTLKASSLQNAKEAIDKRVKITRLRPSYVAPEVKDVARVCGAGLEVEGVYVCGALTCKEHSRRGSKEQFPVWRLQLESGDKVYVYRKTAVHPTSPTNEHGMADKYNWQPSLGAALDAIDESVREVTLARRAELARLEQEAAKAAEVAEEVQDEEPFDGRPAPPPPPKSRFPAVD